MLPKRCCVVVQGQRLVLFNGEEERDSSFGLVLKNKRGEGEVLVWDTVRNMCPHTDLVTSLLSVPSI